VLAGTSRRALAAVGTFASHGSELVITAATDAPCLGVQAPSAAGALLRSSPVVAS
jgi:hypothetical protein